MEFEDSPTVNNQMVKMLWENKTTQVADFEDCEKQKNSSLVSIDLNIITEEDNQKNKKQIQLQRARVWTPPILLVILPKDHVHIFGDLIVHTNINQLHDFMGINNPFNLVKKVENILYEKRKKVLEINFQNANNCFVDFDGVIQLFYNYPDQGIHEFGQNLQKYKQYSMQQRKMSQICAKQPGFEDFQRLKYLKYERFKQACGEIIDQIEKESHFCYVFCQRNFTTGALEMKTSGLNDNLIELLGSNVADFSNLSRRAGLYQLQSKYMYNFIHNKLIEWMGKYMQSTFDPNENQRIVKAASLTYQSQLLTTDEYTLDTEIELETYVDISDEDHDIAKDLLKFRDSFHLFKMKVSPDTIDFLKRQRKENPQTNNDLILKESLYYELESSIFQEKFYSQKSEKITPSSTCQEYKICGFRTI